MRHFRMAFQCQVGLGFHCRNTFGINVPRGEIGGPIDVRIMNKTVGVKT